MAKRIGAKLAAGILAAALACGIVAACAPVGTQESEAAQENRAYMAQVNQIMVDLDDSLATFVDAVSQDDAVNVSVQADDALRTLARLRALEAPEALEDVHGLYVQGADKLEEALQAYIDLYEEVKGTSDFSEYSWEGYATRVAEIQKTYDEGVELLAQADEYAASR